MAAGGLATPFGRASGCGPQAAQRPARSGCSVSRTRRTGWPTADGRSRSAERYAFGAGRLGIGEASHAQRIEEAEEACENGDEQGDLEGAVPRFLVDAEDVGLHVFGLAGEERFELGAAHHLGVVFEGVRDLLLLGRWDHLAVFGL